MGKWRAPIRWATVLRKTVRAKTRRLPRVVKAAAMVVPVLTAAPLLTWQRRELLTAGRMLARRKTEPPSYVLTRELFVRLLGGVYLCAFASLWPQLRGLIGRNGVVPAAEYLEALEGAYGRQRFRQVPTLLWIRRDDTALRAVCGTGIGLSALLILGVLPAPVLALLWACYLSLVTVGRPFLSFQWDILLLETGFLATFFAPVQPTLRLSRAAPPSPIVVWLLRLLLFRLMFFSGVVKLRSGDRTWRDLTALSYHYETQPLPTPLAPYVHRLPRRFHVMSAAMTFVLELFVPFLIFAPRPLRLAAAGVLAWLQLLIIATGNYAFFNLLSIVLCIPALDDAAIRRALPRRVRALLPPPTSSAPVPLYAHAAALPVAATVLALMGIQNAGTIWGYARLPRWASSLSDWLDPFRLVNPYGLFAVMTTSRPEIVVEGSADGQSWHGYEFRYKPGDLDRPPPWVAPHQPRLDWQMWFAALGGRRSERWFAGFMLHLLRGTPEVLALLGTNPFPDAPPRYVRALLYSYHFAGPVGEGETGRWWRRELLGLYFPPVSLAE